MTRGDREPLGPREYRGEWRWHSEARSAGYRVWPLARLVARLSDHWQWVSGFNRPGCGAQRVRRSHSAGSQSGVCAGVGESKK